ncbi:serine/threonine-protein kinase [Sarcoptes scabiei]|nr:serine/threonine-protein kinase [Sarcoptes scabiei]
MATTTATSLLASTESISDRRLTRSLKRKLSPDSTKEQNETNETRSSFHDAEIEASSSIDCDQAVDKDSLLIQDKNSSYSRSPSLFSLLNDRNSKINQVDNPHVIQSLSVEPSSLSPLEISSKDSQALSMPPPTNYVVPKRKMVLCKNRTYDPDQHCGVITGDNQHCTRSLTCREHPIASRRIVLGRTKPFDVLLKEYRIANNIKNRPSRSKKSSSFLISQTVSTNSQSIISQTVNEPSLSNPISKVTIEQNKISEEQKISESSFALNQTNISRSLSAESDASKSLQSLLSPKGSATNNKITILISKEPSIVANVNEDQLKLSSSDISKTTTNKNQLDVKFTQIKTNESDKKTDQICDQKNDSVKNRGSTDMHDDDHDSGFEDKTDKIFDDIHQLKRINLIRKELYPFSHKGSNRQNLVKNHSSSQNSTKIHNMKQKVDKKLTTTIVVASDIKSNETETIDRNHSKLFSIKPKCFYPKPAYANHRIDLSRSLLLSRKKNSANNNNTIDQDEDDLLKINFDSIKTVKPIDGSLHSENLIQTIKDISETMEKDDLFHSFSNEVSKYDEHQSHYKFPVINHQPAFSVFAVAETKQPSKAENYVRSDSFSSKSSAKNATHFRSFHNADLADQSDHSRSNSSIIDKIDVIEIDDNEKQSSKSTPNLTKSNSDLIISNSSSSLLEQKRCLRPKTAQRRSKRLKISENRFKTEDVIVIDDDDDNQDTGSFSSNSIELLLSKSLDHGETSGNQLDPKHLIVSESFPEKRKRISIHENNPIAIHNRSDSSSVSAGTSTSASEIVTFPTCDIKHPEFKLDDPSKSEDQLKQKASSSIQNYIANIDIDIDYDTDDMIDDVLDMLAELEPLKNSQNQTGQGQSELEQTLLEQKQPEVTFQSRKAINSRRTNVDSSLLSSENSVTESCSPKTSSSSTFVSAQSLNISKDSSNSSDTNIKTISDVSKSKASSDLVSNISTVPINQPPLVAKKSSPEIKSSSSSINHRQILVPLTFTPTGSVNIGGQNTILGGPISIDLLNKNIRMATVPVVQPGSILQPQFVPVYQHQPQQQPQQSQAANVVKQSDVKNSHTKNNSNNGGSLGVSYGVPTATQLTAIPVAALQNGKPTFLLPINSVNSLPNVFILHPSSIDQSDSAIASSSSSITSTSSSIFSQANNTKSTQSLVSSQINDLVPIISSETNRSSSASMSSIPKHSNQSSPSISRLKMGTVCSVSSKSKSSLSNKSNGKILMDSGPQASSIILDQFISSSIASQTSTSSISTVATTGSKAFPLTSSVILNRTNPKKTLGTRSKSSSSILLNQLNSITPVESSVLKSQPTSSSVSDQQVNQSISIGSSIIELSSGSFSQPNPSIVTSASILLDHSNPISTIVSISQPVTSPIIVNQQATMKMIGSKSQPSPSSILLSQLNPRSKQASSSILLNPRNRMTMVESKSSSILLKQLNTKTAAGRQLQSLPSTILNQQNPTMVGSKSQPIPPFMQVEQSNPNEVKSQTTHT